MTQGITWDKPLPDQTPGGTGVKWDKPLPSSTPQTAATPEIKWDKPIPTAQPAQTQPVQTGTPKDAVYGVGPNAVMQDFNTPFTAFGKGGVRPQFKSMVNHLSGLGYHFGVYDFNRGHHYAPNDPHLDGRAMDVDVLNGESIGTQFTPKIGRFITDALSASPFVRVGVPQAVFDEMQHLSLGGRIFVDNPNHIHVEITPQGLSQEAQKAIAPQPQQIAHAAPGHDIAEQVPLHTMVAGIPFPVSKNQATAFARYAAMGEATVRAAGAVYQRIPVNLIADFLGSPQRAVGEGIGAAAGGHDIGEIARAMWNGLTHASTAQHATHAVEALLAHGDLGNIPIPGGWSREQVNSIMQLGDIPAQLRPYIRAGVGGINDFTAQTLSDPLTYLGGLGVIAKGVAWGARGMAMGAHALEAFDDVLQASRATQAAKLAGAPTLRSAVTPLAALAHASASLRAASGAASRGIKSFTAVRPELEDFSLAGGKRGAIGHSGGFTPEGKQRRMSIESSEVSLQNDSKSGHMAALNSGSPKQIGTAYLQMMYEHGGPRDSAIAARLLNLPANAARTGYLAGAQGLSGAHGVLSDILSIGKEGSAYSAQDAAIALSRGRQVVRDARTADRTATMAQEFPGSLQAGTTAKTAEDFRTIPSETPRLSSNPIFASMRELQRSFVMLFPFIHGIGNVGQLTYLSEHSGGLSIVPKALHYMVGHMSNGKLGPLVDTERLKNIGGAATYVHEHEAGQVWAAIGEHLGAPGQWAENYVATMQKALGVMENGWRGALLDTLDANKATKDLDELRKGALVASHVGDPRNQAAFVRMFEQLGGPFVAYRMGIVPRAVLDAITKNPQRVLAAVRPQLDIQNNRSQQAQHANVLELGGPVTDAARLFGPGYLSYLLSPSTIGLLGDMFQMSTDDRERVAWASMLGNVVGWLNPFGSLQKAATWMMPEDPKAFDAPMPGQRKSLTDSLMGSTMGTFVSFYLAKQMNEKYESQQQHKNYKEAMEIYQHWIDLLYGGGHH